MPYRRQHMHYNQALFGFVDLFAHICIVFNIMPTPTEVMPTGIMGIIAARDHQARILAKMVVFFGINAGSHHDLDLVTAGVESS